MKVYVLDYILNKFCPIIIVAILCFMNMGVETFEPYIVMGMMLYACHFNYKVGHAMGICESKNLI